MARGKDLTEAKRGEVLGLHSHGLSQRAIESELGLARTTIQYTISQASKRGDNQKSLKQSDRPYNESYQAALRLVTDFPFTTTDKLEEVYGGPIKLFNRRRRANNPELCHKPASGQQALSEKGREKRMAFVNKEISRLSEGIHLDAWFTDECLIRPGQTAARPWLWVPRGKSRLSRYTDYTPLRSACLMIWGAIHSTGQIVLLFPIDFQDGGTQTVNGNIYLAMLEDFLTSHYRPGQVFIQDNAPAHTDHRVKDYLAELGIFHLDWPPYSPDLNVIENFWRLLKLEVHNRQPHLRRLTGGPERKARQIKDAVLATIDQIQSEEGWNLPQKLAESWPRRLEAVRAAEGHRTKY